MNPVDRLKTLLDPERLAVAGALAVGPGSVSELAGRTQLADRRVLEALGDLVSAGLAHPDGAVFRLDLASLQETGRALADTELPMDPVIGFGMTDEERLVLSRFFEGRTLAEVPSSRAKRLIVLERLALEFDLGRRYHEFEVNDILGAFHPDWSTLRRHLVDEGFLDREQGGRGNVYWRSGGRVPGLGTPSPA
ncbi:MAG: DUF2087 domain-containing protein [Actinomycetota bacterium]